MDLVRPAAILLPCARCQAPLEIRFSVEGNLLIEAGGAPPTCLPLKTKDIQISQLDLFFHWEKVEQSVAESLKSPYLGSCPLCHSGLYLEKDKQVVVECEYCGGKTAVAAEDLHLRRKEEVPTLPASILSLLRRIARPVNDEEKKQVVLRYLRLYRWLLLMVGGALVLIVFIILRGILRTP